MPDGDVEVKSFNFGEAFQLAMKIVRFVKENPEVVELVKEVIDLFRGKVEVSVAASCEKPCETA